MKNVEVYYLRKTYKGQEVPYAVVAVEMNEDKTVNRGIAVCSNKDYFVKSKGRGIAMNRLEAIKKNNEKKFVINEFFGKNKCMPEIPFEKLAYHHDEPTEFEKRMFRSA